jgi:hypothetical protein
MFWPTLMVQLFEPKMPKLKKVGHLQTRLGGSKGVPFDSKLRDITFGGGLSSW